MASKSNLNPNYHKSGIETYQIFKGNGIMKIGRLQKTFVKWVETFHV